MRVFVANNVFSMARPTENNVVAARARLYAMYILGQQVAANGGGRNLKLAENNRQAK